MKTKFLILVLCLYSSLSFAQFQPASFMSNGYTLPYQVMFPEDYDKSQQYPLVIFLHGSGEKGNDNEKQLVHGKDFLINNFQSQYPAIVIVPQCPQESFWSNVQTHSTGNERTFTFGASEKPTPPMEVLITLIKNYLSSGKVDTKQVYVGGLSMGGMGAFELLWQMPDTFAAAFPICGGGDVNRILHNTKNTALWIFHGEVDNVVPAKFSQDIYNTLKEAGNDVKYTEYPDVTHNSWDNAFQEKDLASWLFSHKK